MLPILALFSSSHANAPDLSSAVGTAIANLNPVVQDSVTRSPDKQSAAQGAQCVFAAGDITQIDIVETSFLTEFSGLFKL
jgi:hypothetical protein